MLFTTRNIFLANKGGGIHLSLADKGGGNLLPLTIILVAMAA